MELFKGSSNIFLNPTSLLVILIARLGTWQRRLVGKSQKQDVSVSGACIPIVSTNANIGISAVCDDVALDES